VNADQNLTPSAALRAPSGAPKSSPGLLPALADFRYELRRFLHFSESAALEAGLQPQQHQLLLQVAGATETAQVTIAFVAGRLALKHNSAVELVDRSEREGLLERTPDAKDRRCTILHLTRKGRKMLERLSDAHAHELHEMGPRLITALEEVRQHARSGTSLEAQ
jgi:DNA-binding MarR family transcriptional regulator